MKSLKDKPARRYSLLSNVGFSLGYNYKESPGTVYAMIVGTLARIGAPFMAILLPKIVIDCLSIGEYGGMTPLKFILRVGMYALAYIILTILVNYTNNAINDEFGMIGSGYLAESMVYKKLDIDLDLLSDPAVIAAEEKADLAAQSNHTPAANMPMNISGIVTQLGGLILYGSIISAIHPAIIVFLVLSAVITYFMMNRATKYSQKNREERSRASAKTYYIGSEMLGSDIQKDFRLYGMFGWFMKHKKAAFADSRRIYDSESAKDMQATIVSALMVLIRDGGAYALLVYLLINRKLEIGDFVMMFAAIGAFAGWVEGVITQYTKLRRASNELTDLRAYLDLPDRMNRGAGPAIAKDSAPELVLENVSYAYPGSDNMTLRNINLTIRPGEKLAVVGVNGAGKSTLVKLICGLTIPTEGRVLLNGRDIREFNRDEYYSIFSAVFQEIYLQPASIAVNISQQAYDKTDYGRVNKCLELAGLDKKIASLEKGYNSMLIRSVETDAVELSGGEMQKLALARALYKESTFIVLDEPTAALDPIAESEMYSKYAELTAGKTSLYISHRLASTKFCDRIILIDGNIVAETGTHEVLMALGGKYAEMFSVQAQYYKDEEESVYAAE